uniref:tRNA pseudouridine(55) synthase n=1 Tax=Macrostomum lignano TaxID=282301 RepID=A0A1I8FRX3_9PLAT
VLRCHETKCSRRLRQTLSRQPGGKFAPRCLARKPTRKPELSRELGTIQASISTQATTCWCRTSAGCREAILLLMILRAHCLPTGLCCHRAPAAALFRGVGLPTKGGRQSQLGRASGVTLTKARKLSGWRGAEDPADYLAFLSPGSLSSEQRKSSWRLGPTVLQALELNPDHTDSAHCCGFVVYRLPAVGCGSEGAVSRLLAPIPTDSSILITRASLAAFLHGLRRAVNVYRARHSSPGPDRFGDTAVVRRLGVGPLAGRLDSELKWKRDQSELSTLHRAWSPSTSDCSLSASGGRRPASLERRRLQVRILLGAGRAGYVDHGMLQERATRCGNAKQLDAVSINPVTCALCNGLGLLLIRQAICRSGGGPVPVDGAGTEANGTVVPFYFLRKVVP